MATSHYTPQSGIYIILNTLNGHIYIGQAQDLSRRWRKHRYELKANVHDNRHLQAAWNKYGASAFTFHLLEECPVNLLNEREQYYLDAYIPQGICYNIAKNAIATLRGVRFSDEHREKIRKALKGKPHSEERRQKNRESHLNPSAESRLRMSAAQKGNKNSLGRVVGDETRHKLSVAQKGKRASAETLLKMSEVQKGKKFSAEHRRKLSEAAKRRYAKEKGLLGESEIP